MHFEISIRVLEFGQLWEIFSIDILAETFLAKTFLGNYEKFRRPRFWPKFFQLFSRSFGQLWKISSTEILAEFGTLI